MLLLIVQEYVINVKKYFVIDVQKFVQMIQIIIMKMIKMKMNKLNNFFIVKIV